MSNDTDSDDLLNAADFLPTSVEPPDAWCGHLSFGAWIVRKLEPRLIVELGTHSGNSYFTFCLAVDSSRLPTRCYAIDTWTGDEYAGFYGEEIFAKVREHNERFYAGFSRLMRMTFDQALGYFSNGTIDLLHIDGRHSYEEVRHDFESWLPKLAPGAVVLLHDTAVRERGFGVWRLWEDLRQLYPCNLEFPHSNGLGVLQLDGAAERSLAFLRPDFDGQERYQRYFAALGASQLERAALQLTRINALNLQQTVADRDRRIAELDRALKKTTVDADRQVAERDRLNAELRDKLSALNARASSLEATIDDLRSSTSWRITAPWRLLGRLLQWRTALYALRRRRFLPSAKPLRELEKTCNAGNTWKSTGQDPCFELLTGARLPRRWVRLRIWIAASDSAPLFATLYVDGGEGFREASCLDLPEPIGGVIDVIRLLPHRVLTLRFDPMRRLGEFALGAIEFQEIGKIEAGLRLVARLLKKRVRTWRDVKTLLRSGRASLSEGGLTHFKDWIIRTESDCRVPPRIPVNYGDWVERYERRTDAERTLIRDCAATLTLRPRISVIMPVYNTDLSWLRPAIESIRSQLYPEWELCLSDDASTLPGIREELRRYAEQDGRIRVAFREENGHISANSNTALALASGAFVALVDSDDLLPEDALFWVAQEINACPEVDLIYSDEDKIDTKGRRYDPYFKPDWNPSLLLSQNFFCHLGVYRRSLVEQVGGFRLGFEGSQDHDLVLRCADASDPARVRHIPRILYHWRAVPGSTASQEGASAKPYAWTAGARAIEEHLARNGIPGRVTTTVSSYYQVEYTLPAEHPKISIIMPSACRLELLRPCISALLARTTYRNFEVLVVVNEIRFKVPEQAAYLHDLQQSDKIRVLVYSDREFNYSWVNNWAAGHASGSIFCLMNDDVEVVTPDWLEKFAARLQIRRVGAVGAKLYFPDNTIQHAGVMLGLGGVAGHTFIHLPRTETGYFCRASLEQDLSCVTAACMAVRREAFEQVAGFNENLAIAFNDVDLCIRLRKKGWRILWTPQIEHYHHESATIGHHNSPERAARFREEVEMMRQMWGPYLDADPFHNPNLSLDDHLIDLACPPRIAKLPVLLPGKASSAVRQRASGQESIVTENCPS